MIEEVRSGARQEGSLTRRWYSSSEFDLYVWRESTHEIVQFQLYWKRPAKIHDADHIPEEAITWSREIGLQQAQVGEAGRYKAPVLIEHSEVEFAEIVAAFESDALPSNYPDIRFVLAKMAGQVR